MKKYKTFEKTYAPQTRDDETLLWETYGKDIELIKKQNPRNVWTLLDCDGKLILCAGVHFVNRMNYLITEMPWKSGLETFSY